MSLGGTPSLKLFMKHTRQSDCLCFVFCLFLCQRLHHDKNLICQGTTLEVKVLYESLLLILYFKVVKGKREQIALKQVKHLDA